MGNDYLWPPYKMLATAESSHNPDPVVKLEPPTIDSNSVAELEYSVRNVPLNMDVMPEEPQQQQQVVVAAADQSAPCGRAKWTALVDVCSMLFEQILEAEKAEMERSLISGGELTVAQNVTVGNQDQPKVKQEVKEEDESYEDDFSDDVDDDDDEDGDNLVIDEDPEPPPKKQSVVALHNSKRASVIIAVPRHIESSVTTGSSSVQSDSEPQPSTSSDSGCSRSQSGGSGDGGGSSVSDSSASGPYPKRKRHSSFRRPKHMSQLTLDPSVPFQVEVRYNKNMARSFPGTEDRTPEQQALRTRNTLAARQSRAKLRMLDEILSHEAENESLLNEFVKERVAACFTYGNYLRELQDLEPMDFWGEFETIKDHYVVEPLRAQHHVPRGTGPPLRRLRSDFEHDDDENMEQSEEREDAPRRSPMPWEDFIERVFPMFRFGRRGDLRGDLSGDLGGEF